MPSLRSTRAAAPTASVVHLGVAAVLPTIRAPRATVPSTVSLWFAPSSSLFVPPPPVPPPTTRFVPASPMCRFFVPVSKHSS